MFNQKNIINTKMQKVNVRIVFHPFNSYSNFYLKKINQAI